MTDPITPPPELLQQWHEECHKVHKPFLVHIANQSSQWGADQELEACCEWMKRHLHSGPQLCKQLRAARRPKPPSLKDHALEAAQRFYAKGHEGCTDEEVKDDFDAICRALEALPND